MIVLLPQSSVVSVCHLLIHDEVPQSQGSSCLEKSILLLLAIVGACPTGSTSNSVYSDRMMFNTGLKIVGTQKVREAKHVLQVR